MQSKLFSALAVASLFSVLTPLVPACNTQTGVKVTFYGYPDNSPPGGDISHDCGRGATAGGVGTYDDPVTFASTTSGIFKYCEIIYIPYLKKYARFEDICGQCNIDFNNSGLTHIDIWMGSPTINGGRVEEACEADFTRPSKTIVRDPLSFYEVDSRDLFANGKCSTGGKYFDGDVNGLCIAD